MGLLDKVREARAREEAEKKKTLHGKNAVIHIDGRRVEPYEGPLHIESIEATMKQVTFDDKHIVEHKRVKKEMAELFSKRMEETFVGVRPPMPVVEQLKDIFVERMTEALKAMKVEVIGTRVEGNLLHIDMRLPVAPYYMLDLPLNDKDTYKGVMMSAGHPPSCLCNDCLGPFDPPEETPVMGSGGGGGGGGTITLPPATVPGIGFYGAMPKPIAKPVGRTQSVLDAIDPTVDVSRKDCYNCGRNSRRVPMVGVVKSSQTPICVDCAQAIFSTE